MKIGVDCHVLKGKYQGSKTYVAGLYNAVLALNPKHNFIFFGSGSNKYFGEDRVYAEYKSDSRWKRLTYQTAPLVKRYKLDIFHSNYIAPIILTCRSLLTVHDILFETHPQFFTRNEVLRNRLLVKHSVKNATLIHTVSEFSKRALINIYQIPSDRIHIVPNGVDLIRFNPVGHKSAAVRINDLFNIKDYILSVGRLEPRKNHIGLLRAYGIVRQRNRNVGPLVLVGQRDFHYQEIFDEVDNLNLRNSVKILESVNNDLLPIIYQAARLFVYPSFAEGFGVPPLEAMACGVPVVTSNTSALPEVVGDAGFLVNPSDPEDIAEAMLEVLSDQELSNNFAVKGRIQAEGLTWDNAAKSYIYSLKGL